MSYRENKRSLLYLAIRRMVRSRFADLLLAPIYGFCVLIGLTVKRIGVQHLSITRKTGEWLGGQFVSGSYYEPLPQEKARLSRKLNLGYKPINEQISNYRELCISRHLNLTDLETEINVNLEKHNVAAFDVYNETFHSLDALVYWKFLLKCRPKHILEIGSGNSTKIALAYKSLVSKEGGDVNLVCIEPFEVDWLESVGVNLVRLKVEDISEVGELIAEGMLLFIDSSHVVKIGGDVEVIYSELLPRLPSGTYVHIHDIFSPNAFAESWRYYQQRLWGEQVVVDALVAVSFLDHLFSVSCLRDHLIDLDSVFGKESSNLLETSAYFAVK